MFSLPHPVSFFVSLVVDVLEVEEHGVGALHQPQELTIKRLLTREGLRGRVETGVNAPTVRFFEKFDESVDLQQRLSAAHGDATFLPPVGSVAFRLVEELSDGHRLAPFGTRCPRVGVVTVTAPHAAPLEKNDKTNSRPVYRAEGFERVNMKHIL